MAHVIRLHASSGFTRALARGVREGGADFRRWDTLAELPLPVRPVEEQRRIADFLDDRVARIDRIIAARHQQRTLLEEQIGATRHQIFSDLAATPGVPVRSLNSLLVTGAARLGRGNVISKDDIAACPGGYPVYSSARDNDGAIGTYGKYMFDEELVTWSVDGGGHVFYRSPHKFSITNICGYARVLQPEAIRCEYLAESMKYAHSQHYFDWQEKAHPGVIRDLYTAITLPLVAAQEEIIYKMSLTRSAISQADSALTRSIGLLSEYKQSLITAAVTGELDVTTAGSGIPG